MLKVAVIGRKGGVGKTTISVHLAGELSARGRTVVLVDADPQGSASHWASPKKLSFSVEKMPVTAANVREWAQKVRRISVDFLVIDCPPHRDHALGAAVALADLVLLPCGPSGLDMMAMTEALTVVQEARRERKDGKPKALVIPNKVDRRTSEGRELFDELVKFGEPVGPALAYRSAFVRAFNTGETVGIASPGTPADLEVKALADAVEKH